MLETMIGGVGTIPCARKRPLEVVGEQQELLPKPTKRSPGCLLSVEMPQADNVSSLLLVLRSLGLALFLSLRLLLHLLS